MVVKTLSAVPGTDKHLVRVSHYHIKQKERMKDVGVSVSFFVPLCWLMADF